MVKKKKKITKTLPLQGVEPRLLNFNAVDK
jgi:hypothetical protein